MADGGTLGSYVRMDPVKLAELLRSSQGPVMRHTLELGHEVKREAQRLVGVSKPDPVPGRKAQRRPGTLRDSIVVRIASVGGDPAVLVGSDDPIALLHHEGTMPHVITPRRAKRLVFFWPKAGRIVAFPKVNHPGTQPNRYLVRALDVIRGR